MYFPPFSRLWIVTTETNKFPSAELKQCLKLTSEQPFTLRDSIIISFTKGSIKDAKCWSGDSWGGNERHISRLLFCLAFFHASINGYKTETFAIIHPDPLQNINSQSIL